MSAKPPSRPLPAEARGAALGARRVWLGCVSGALAGAAAGAIDALWSWTAMTQFLPALSDKLLFLLHLALSYAFAGAVVGSAVAKAIHILHAYTALPFVLQLLAGGKGKGPKLGALSHILAGVPVAALVSSAAFWNAQHLLVGRKHAGLVIASSIVITFFAVALGSLIVLATAPLLGLAMRPLRKVALLASPWTSGAVLVVLCIAVGYPMYSYWLGKLGSMPWSQLWTVPAGLALFVAMPPLGGRLLRSMNDRLPEDQVASPRALLLVVIGLSFLALSLGAAFFIGARGIDTKATFVIARVMGITSCALALALYATLLVTLILERSVLRSAFGSHPALTSKRAPYLAAAFLLVVGTVLGLTLTWKTVSLLRLRGLWVLGAALLLSFGTLRHARPWSFAIAQRRPSRWIPLTILACVALFGAVLVTGGQESVRKAEVLHSGLGGALAKSYRILGDWDRDGYSRWLGGGDCDDSNPRVHPNAEEIPFDGIDNNCLRGDVKKRTANATRFSTPPPGLPDDFNVILITIDTIRADHLGAYGYKRDTTPNIDALAASGTLFQNGWAHAPSTRYSIPALLTGRHPLNVSYAPIPGQWPGIQDDNLTIAEVLKSRGLSTGAILNYWYFDERRGMNQGFDHYDNKNKRLHRAVKGSGPAKTSGSSSREQTDKAIAFVDEKQQERFFLWVHYYDPHYDYETHEGTKTFGSSQIDAYDHEIAYTDKHIGRLLDNLKEKGLDEKTVIVLTGDHGEGFGEHGIDLHGYHLYAAQTKVPFIIRVPGAKPSVVQMPAGHVDVLPTLANLAGAPSDTAMLGQSLVGVIDGTSDPSAERYVFQQLSYENNNEYRGAASSKCHILYNVSPNLSWELYRIDEDPMEERDIIDSPGECRGARAALETWYDHSEIPMGAQAALLDSAPELENPIAVDYAGAIRLSQLKLPKTVRRGESIAIEYTWAGLGVPPIGWKVFAHFEAKAGGRFTDDHKPPRPFSWWQEGQHFRYTRTLRVPKNQRPGSYDLWFGLYKGNDRLGPSLGPSTKLPIVDRRLHVATIEVLP